MRFWKLVNMRRMTPTIMTTTSWAYFLCLLCSSLVIFHEELIQRINISQNSNFRGLLLPVATGYSVTPSNTRRSASRSSIDGGIDNGKYAYEILRTATNLLDPITGEPSSISFFGEIQSESNTKKKKSTSKSLVVLLPQLGDFDSFEYCEMLVAAQTAMEKNDNADVDAVGGGDINLVAIGIGDTKSAQTFCNFTNFPIEKLLIDPTGDLHQALGLYAGPDLNLPNEEILSDTILRFILNQLPGGAPTDPTYLRPVGKAWLNYLAMCAGIGAPGTLGEIIRGYLGDTNAPERFRSDSIVKAGFVTIGPGVGPVKIGPFVQYSQWFADERGYQRPVELATVRLQNMVEVLTKWKTYVSSNPTAIAQRGGTFLFAKTKDRDDRDEKEKEGEAEGSVKLLYSYQSKGVLTYSETMGRPLTFLEPYIGEEIARNPLQMLDTGGGSLTRGRGILKPAGKAMGVVQRIFQWETNWQAKTLWGAQESDFLAAQAALKKKNSSHNIVIYTYGLSPFSLEAIAVLEELKKQMDEDFEYEKVELGLEWFLLNKEQSTLRAALLEETK